MASSRSRFRSLKFKNHSSLSIVSSDGAPPFDDELEDGGLEPALPLLDAGAGGAATSVTR